MKGYGNWDDDDEDDNFTPGAIEALFAQGRMIFLLVIMIAKPTLFGDGLIGSENTP